MSDNKILIDFKEIHIGNLIQQRVLELEIDLLRICKYFDCTSEDIENVYSAGSVDLKILLRWSKLLEYDFFRIYSQHLILFAPCQARIISQNLSSLPTFRKSLYTKEIIDFILRQYNSGTMSRKEIYKRYNIPKTTFGKWVIKYSNQ